MKITNKTQKKLIVSAWDIEEDEIEHIILEQGDTETIILIEEANEIIIEESK